MKNNFWKKLQKSSRPIIALAPMADITDAPFRYLCERYGADVIYNEMVSVDAICHHNEKTLAMLKRYQSKKPFVVQLFGNKPENFKEAVKIIDKKFKPDGFDINFGCPAQKVLKNKCGAELFQDLRLSRKVIKAVLGATRKPVSVKIRARAGKMDALAWLGEMKDLPLAAVMVHARSLSQGLSGPVDFDILKKVKKSFSGAVLGNGGIKGRSGVLEMIKKTGVDGVGIGQGCLGKPWIFSSLQSTDCNLQTDKEKIFKVILEHARLHQKIKGDDLVPLRKHLCWYANGLSDAKKLRAQFVQIKTYKELEKIIKEELKK